MKFYKPHFDGCRYQSKEAIDQIINGQIEIVRRLVEDGWKAYYVSILFHQLPGNRKSHLEQMKRAITGIYSRLVTRSVREPRSESWAGYLPVGIFCPDLPVPKSCDGERASVADVSINDGLHMNGIIVANQWGRIRSDLESHFQDNRADYVKGIIRDIGVGRRKKADLRRTGNYVFKCIKKHPRASFSTDDIILLDWDSGPKVDKHSEAARKHLGVSRADWRKIRSNP